MQRVPQGVEHLRVIDRLHGDLEFALRNNLPADKLGEVVEVEFYHFAHASTSPFSGIFSRSRTAAMRATPRSDGGVLLFFFEELNQIFGSDPPLWSTHPSSVMEPPSPIASPISFNSSAFVAPVLRSFCHLLSAPCKACKDRWSCFSSFVFGS